MFHDGLATRWSSSLPASLRQSPLWKTGVRAGFFLQPADQLSPRGGRPRQVCALCPKAYGNCGGAMVFLWHVANDVPPAGSEGTGAPAQLGQASARRVPENVGRAEAEATGPADRHAGD